MATFFPALSPDALHLLGESGTGFVTLDGQPLFKGFGPPCWMGPWQFLYTTETNVQIYSLATHLSTVVYDKPLIELAACPTLWAGRDPSRNVLVVSDGREIPNAGQPAVAPDGDLVYRTGDDRIEPTISNDFIAWGNGAGRIVGYGFATQQRDYTVAAPEYRPRLVDTPDGPWLLTMTHTALRLRPFGATDGFVRETGDNGNLNSSVVCVGRTLIVVYQDARGNLGRWEQSLDAPRKPMTARETPLPDPPMSENKTVPDRKAAVEAFLAPRLQWFRDDLEATRAHTFEQVNALVTEFRKTDARWGLLEKKSGARVKDRASDIALYRISETQAQVVDVVANGEGADGEPPKPYWEVKDIRPITQWKEPFVVDSPEPIEDEPDDRPDPIDTSAEIRALREALDDVIDERERDAFTIQKLAQQVEQHTEALRVLALEIRRLQERKYRVILSRDWGHSHRGTVEVIE